MSTAIRIVLGALYRPHDLIAYLHEKPSAPWILLGIAFTLIVTPFLIALWIIPLFPALRNTDVNFVIAMAPLFGWLMAGLGVGSINADSPILGRKLTKLGIFPDIIVQSIPAICFWFVVMQITMMPILAVGLAIIAANVPPDNALTDTQVICTILLFGVAMGKFFSIQLVIQRKTLMAVDWRWLLVVALVVAAGVLVIVPQVPQALALAVAIFALGVAWAQLRVEAWLWQACWMIGLTRMAALTQRTEWLNRYTLVCFDQLRLLPLPGTTAMLRRLSRSDPRQTAGWLAQLMTHPHDRRLAQRFISSLPASPHSDAIIFWLSIHPIGKALLSSVRSSPVAAPTSLQAYTAFAQVDAAGKWRLQLEHYGAPIASAPAPTDVPWLPDFIRSAQRMLEAWRWQHVERELAPAQGAVTSASVSELVAAWRAAIYATVAMLDGVQPEASWPIHLLDTVSEQLDFLQQMQTDEG